MGSKSIIQDLLPVQRAGPCILSASVIELDSEVKDLPLPYESSQEVAVSEDGKACARADHRL